MSDEPISGNIRGYYKGYSIQITNRDPSVEVKPLLTKMVQMANFMDAHGFKPSWNSDTNKKTEVEPSQPRENDVYCQYHNIKMFKTVKMKSHAHRDENRGWCNGKGFPDELESHREKLKEEKIHQSAESSNEFSSEDVSDDIPF